MQAEARFEPTLPPLRKWQADALTSARQILLNEAKEYLYVCAPTSAGKSRFMFEAIERLTEVDGTHFIIIGRSSIADQHHDSFEKDFGCRLQSHDDEGEVFITPFGQKVVITTWQGMTRACLRDENFGKVGFIFFDECHIGASNEDAVSVKTIFAHTNPQKKVYVSATTQTVSEALLGTKPGHLFFYSFKDAYEDDILHPVEMVEVHTGIRAQVAAIEAATGRNMEDLEVLEGEDLPDLACQFKDKRVDLSQVLDDKNRTTVSELVRHRHDSMIEIYFNQHVGEQAIFFCPSILAATTAAARFNSMARKLGHQVFAQACYSGMPDTKKLIKNFRNGSTRVIFVVGMLQEGYDHSNLALAFDCRFYRRWNGSRIARLIQKIGRIMRKAPGKPVSRYYYARDVSDFYRNRRLDDPSYPEVSDEPDFGPGGGSSDDFDYDGEGGLTDDEIAEEASIAVADIVRNIETEGSSDDLWEQTCDVNPSTVEHIAGTDRKRITLVRTPLYVVKKLRGHVIVRQWNVGQLFGNSADANKAALLAMPEGSPKPIQKKHPLAVPLSCYTYLKHGSYDSIFDAAIRGKHPRWFENSADLNKVELLAMPTRSPRPVQVKHPLGTPLSCYTNPKTSSYDPVFDAAIRAKQPQWFENTADVNKAALLALPEGCKKPSRKNNPLGGALKSYTIGPKRDPVFDAAIRAKQPQWFENSAELKKAELLAMPVGSPKPIQKKHPLAVPLSCYTNLNSETYDPVFNAAIRAMQPQWFENSAELKKAELLAMPEGSPRPSCRNHPLGTVLLNYTNPKTSSYDPIFDAAIRAKQPQWFENSAESNKTALLAIPKGSPRPVQVKHPLGMALSRYTNPNKDSFDPDFSASIRKKQPHWFKK